MFNLDTGEKPVFYKTVHLLLITMENQQLRQLFAQEDIQSRITELASVISNDYQGRHLVILGVLKGSFIFMADIIRQLSLRTTIDFVQISSYGALKESSGTCLLQKDLSVDIEGKDVLIVEDIIDTGETLSFLLEKLQTRSPASVKLCTLINKTGRRTKDLTVDYYGFMVENEFVVGYGLDFNEQHRELPGIFELVDT